MKVLLAVDVLHPYEPLIGEVQRLLPGRAADIKILYVAERSNKFEKVLSAIGKSSSEVDQRLVEKAGQDLNNISALLKPMAASVSTSVIQGSPHEAVNAFAREHHCDVIVIAAEHDEFRDQNALGSTANSIIKNATGTLLVVRPKISTHRPLQRALVGLDGSAQALKALRKFVEQFAALERKIDIALVNIVSIIGIWKYISPAEFVASIEDNLNMAGETILAEGEKVLDEYKLRPSDMFIRTGDVAHELTKAAYDIGADCVVVGAQGKTAMEQLLVGSCSYKLAQQSHLPLVIVK